MKSAKQNAPRTKIEEYDVSMRPALYFMRMYRVDSEGEDPDEQTDIELKRPSPAHLGVTTFTLAGAVVRAKKFHARYKSAGWSRWTIEARSGLQYDEDTGYWAWDSLTVFESTNASAEAK